MKRSLCHFCSLFILTSYVILPVHGGAEGTADYTSTPHLSHAGFIYDGGAGHSGVYAISDSVQEDVIMFSQSRTNNTCTTATWTITDTTGTENSWKVGASAETEVSSGILSRIVVDGKIKVAVNGELSGSKTHSITVSDSNSIPAKHKYRFELKCDKPTAVRGCKSWSKSWLCQKCDESGLDDEIWHSGTGTGDDQVEGTWTDLGKV